MRGSCEALPRVALVLQRCAKLDLLNTQGELSCSLHNAGVHGWGSLHEA